MWIKVEDFLKKGSHSFLVWDQKVPSMHIWNMSEITPGLLAIRIQIEAVCPKHEHKILNDWYNPSVPMYDCLHST